MYPQPDPTEVATDFDDFANYVAADWTVTNTTTHQTIGLVAGAGGIISSVGGGSSVANDIGAIIANPLNFNLPANTVSGTYPPTAKAWFYSAFKATTALNDQLQIGVTSANAALTPTDGIYFNKAAAANTIQFVVRKGSASLAATAYSTGTTTIATLANATFLELGWYYDGTGNIDVFVNEQKVCSVDVGQASGTVAATFPVATALGHGFGIKASATAPTTADMVVDFMLTAQTRPY
jgi:hypothetical protein